MSRESCEVQTAVLETTWGRVIVQVSAAGVVACELPVLAGPPANPLRITRVQLPKKSTALARRELRLQRLGLRSPLGLRWRLELQSRERAIRTLPIKTRQLV